MAEEEVVAAAGSPAPSDHKRKHDELESEAPGHVEPSSELPTDLNAVPDADKKADDLVVEDSSEAKRPRLEEKADGLVASENGFQAENSDSHAYEENEEPIKEMEKREGAELPPEEVQVPLTTEEVEVAVNVAQPSIHDSGDIKLENSQVENSQEPSKEETQEPFSEAPQDLIDHSAQQVEPTSDAQTITHKIEVPNNKVGVLIGKAGDTIRYLQYNSGAKIQIMRDADADPHSTTRPVELIGSLSSVNKAEKLINAVIAEADAGGSPSLVARGLASAQATGAAEQIEIQVPNEKVGLIIGRGGETIKGLQARSGARIQLIPQHVPEGDGSKERTVRVTGDKRQIDIAREMIKEVMNQNVRSSSHSGSFNQQAYRPRGSPGLPQWGPRGSHPSQPMGYDYHQRGPYQSQNQQYPPPTYSNYLPQMTGRGNFGSGWEQRPPPNMQGPPHSGGYDYPVSGLNPGPSGAMGPPPSQANYNYAQPHGPDYGHPGSYPQSAPQHGYGHGYDEPKYDNHGPSQHSYGGHGGSQPAYPQGGAQAGYTSQQQYGKPPYGVPSQGPPPQSYGPRAGHPGDAAYQGSASVAQSYNPNVQQQYPYASSGSVQQTYPSYGGAPVADGYNQPPPSSGPGYPQQGGQALSGYGQPGGQHAPGYGQVNPAGGYGAYQSTQQGYSEQQAPNSAGYYQGPQDPAYSGGTPQGYGATSAAQPAYPQQAPAQPTYDQSAPQSGGYGAPAATAPVGYGKTVSPQPGYAQYDSAQMYAAPR